MKRKQTLVLTLCAHTCIAAVSVGEAPRFDLSKDKVLYCVGYAHLDTQWRWDFRTTIDKYIRDTLERNFALFDKYPGYAFNFTGSVRYEMMKEYYPAEYARLRQYIADGRWFVSGSSVDEGDVNVPSAEAVMRQVLYGNQFFRREFGKESVDFMLPDCFGFPASMPSIWAHCGLKGFSTQKLTWGSAVGIPFKVGVWEGPDGKSVIAALDPGAYVGAIEGRVDLNSQWVERVHENGRRFGVWADFHYYGVGDQGGAPKEEDVRNYLASVDQPDSQIKVFLGSSDQMFKDITSDQKARLPKYRGDMLLTEHSAGTLTSQAHMKRWNRKNEILADAAERAAVASSLLGATQYPREKLHTSWVRLLANQMHDILPGTSIPRAYMYSWNDEIVAANGFAAVLDDSVGAVTARMDTRTEGQPLVVYNPLAIEREDVVEATVHMPSADVPRLRVFDPHGRPVPTQAGETTPDGTKVLFLAKTPSVSWSAYDVRFIAEAPETENTLSVSTHGLENEHYRVTINDDGDIAGIIDKDHENRELLASPAKLEFTYERPLSWPAWNMDWADRKEPPIDAVRGPAKIRVVERGPVRVALEIERSARDSFIRQTVRLTKGDAGRRIEIVSAIDWQSEKCALKAAFPLTVANPKATYNWGMGTLERGNNEPTKYEVPSHEWFDLTDAGGGYGVSVLEDCKFGSDKPADNLLRLTLLYSPGVRSGYLDQHSQDWGRHDMVHALYGHSGDWRAGVTEWQARRLNQPLRAWTTTPHDGPLGRTHSLLACSTPQVDVRAIKLAEESDRTIVRLQELWGRTADDVIITAASPIIEAEEVDGQERPISPARVRDGKLAVNITPYSPRSFAVKLAAPKSKATPPTSIPVPLDYDTDVVSHDANPADGRFDAEGRTIPAEMLPRTVFSEGIEFRMGPTEDGANNALTCRGQTLALPSDAERVHLLAAAEVDTTATFQIGDRAVAVSIPSWTGFVGQWDDRVWDRSFAEVDHVCEGHVTAIRTGFIKREPIGWFCTHRHHPQHGNEAYLFSYLFVRTLELRPGDRLVKLPDDPRIKILAATAARNVRPDVTPAAPLYDDFTGREPIQFRHVYPPPPRPVYEGVAAIARLQMERKESFADLTLGPPSSVDLADRASEKSIEFRFFNGNRDYPPHPRAGAVDDRLPRLNDGEVAQNHDDTKRCVWFDNEGRFFVDLGASTRLARINTFSWHRENRARQSFSLWGSNAEQMPSPAFGHGNHEGWTLLAVVETKDLGPGGIHVTSVQPESAAEALGPFRHLLWIASDIGQGTFFTEIDVHAAP